MFACERGMRVAVIAGAEDAEGKASLDGKEIEAHRGVVRDKRDGTT